MHVDLLIDCRRRTLFPMKSLSLRGLCVSHCKENPICVLPEKKLCGLSPSFHIHVSLGDLYSPTIGPHFPGAFSFLGIFVSNVRYTVFAVYRVFNLCCPQAKVFRHILYRIVNFLSSIQGLHSVEIELYWGFFWIF